METTTESGNHEGFLTLKKKPGAKYPGTNEDLMYAYDTA